MTTKRFISYDNMHTMLNVIYRSMAKDSYRPDFVVGLVRGGLIPAVHISHYFDVQLLAFKYSLRDHPGSDSFEKLEDLLTYGKQVLIIDDICDEGHTLNDIMQNLHKHDTFITSSYVRTAVLQHNLGSNLFSPDYCGEEINKLDNPEWIVYPWEY